MNELSMNELCDLGLEMMGLGWFWLWFNWDGWYQSGMVLVWDEVLHSR